MPVPREAFAASKRPLLAESVNGCRFLPEGSFGRITLAVADGKTTPETLRAASQVDNRDCHGSPVERAPKSSITTGCT